jgi:hypothetical protein
MNGKEIPLWGMANCHYLQAAAYDIYPLLNGFCRRLHTKTRFSIPEGKLKSLNFES